MADKLRKASSTGVASVAIVTAPRLTGATSLTVGEGALTNWPTTTSVDFSTYTLTNGVISNKCEWTGRADVDNNIITELELTNGTDAGNSVDDIIVCLETAAWVNDLITTLLTIFSLSGSLKTDIIASVNIINSAITESKIANLAVTIPKMALDARKQSLDIDGVTEIVFSTAATQPAAQPGKNIIWFAPAS
jgi:hypothetical protein